MNNQKFIKEKLNGMDYQEFYNISTYFLHTQGYKDISIVDGTNDKGTDVTTSNNNVQIQLSINKKWKDKINSELENALNNDKSTLVYITNQRISPSEQSDFKSTQKYSDKITLIIYDLDSISTQLSLPFFLKRSYELLKIEQPISIEATQEDIAISNILLLSNEAIDLRENILETRILTCIYMNICKKDMDSIISYLIKENFDERMIKKSFSKLQQEQKLIKRKDGSFELSEVQLKIFDTTKFQYELEIKEDKDRLITELKISDNIADEIIKLGLEILSKIKDNSSFDEKIQKNNQSELDLIITNLEDLISRNGLNQKKKKIYEIISSLNITKIQKYKSTLQYITQTTTYDIYRILSKNTKIKIILDTSVAMPVLFALEWGSNHTKFVKTAHYLLELAQKHDFELIIPAPYVKEIAGHGFSICDLPIYEEIINSNSDNLAIDLLRNSQNAFISFYAHFNDKNTYSLKDFLEHFGIYLENREKERYQERARNTINDLLVSHNIKVIQLEHELNNTESYNTIKALINDRKLIYPNYERADSLIINDANVCTYLKQQTDSGYIFATWDNIIPQVIESLSRIYANNPSKVMDLLSFCKNLDSQMDLEIYTTLMFSDEEKLARLAEKIEKIKSPEEYNKKMQLTREIRAQRNFNDSDWLEHKEVLDEVLNTWD